MLGELTNDFFIWTSINCPACSDSLLYIMGNLHVCSKCGHYEKIEPAILSLLNNDKAWQH